MITNLERAQLNCQRLRQLPRDGGLLYANARELEEITNLVEEALSALISEIKSLARRSQP
jgi:hypothetical protein